MRKVELQLEEREMVVQQQRQQQQFSWRSCFLRLVPALNRWCHKRCARPSGAAGTGDAIGQFLDKPLYLDCLSFLQTCGTQGLGQIRSGETITVHFFTLPRRSALCLQLRRAQD